MIRVFIVAILLTSSAPLFATDSINQALTKGTMKQRSWLLETLTETSAHPATRLLLSDMTPRSTGYSVLGEQETLESVIATFEQNQPAARTGH